MDPGRPVNILFVGAGAIGCFYASRLHHPEHGIKVSLVARSNYAQLAASGTVHMTTHDFGDYDFRPTAVYPSVAAAAAASQSQQHHQWDYIWVTTKALPDRGDDAALIAPLVTSASVIVLVQNGIGIEAPYRARFAAAPIVTGVAFISAELASPDTVRQILGARLPLGPYISASPSPSSSSLTAAAGADQQAEQELTDRGTKATTQLADWLINHGGILDIDTHDAVGIQLIRWYKLAINIAMNPSSILSGGRGGGLMARDPVLHEHMAGVMREVWDATPRILNLQQQSQSSQAMYAELPTPDSTLEMVKNFPDSRPSMLLDWEAGRPLEVEVILGNAVRIARERGVELPRTQTLYALMSSMQFMRDNAKGWTTGKL